MNNNIIKRLRRTLLCTVAAAAVAIGFTACADETLTTQNTTAPVNGNGYKFSIPANMGGGGTRAIAYNGTDGYDATFEATEMIFVFDITQGALSTKKEMDWVQNCYLYPDANAKTANLVGELSFTQYDRQTGEYGNEIAPQVGDELMLFYNNDNDVFRYNYNANEYYLNNSGDYALATVKITSIGEDGVIQTSPASFENLQSIYKINFTGIGSNVKIRNINIQSEKNQLVTDYFAFSKENAERFGVVNYTYEGEGRDQHELTFMLRYSDNPDYYENSDNPSTSGDVFSFTALGSDGRCYVGKKNVTTDLENGKYYQAEVAMEDRGVAMKVKNTTTGETLDFSSYCSIFTNDADYIAEYNGYGTCIEWFGGEDDKHTLTIKDLTMYNSKDCAIAVRTGYDDPENTKVHKLVLDGKNTLSVTGYQSSLSVQKNCSLIISSASTGTGKLILKSSSSDGEGLAVSDNAKVTIESGEVIVDGRLWISNNSSCVIAKDGKLRVLTEYLYSAEGIKAASGYILTTTEEGDYTVFTVTEAAPYEDPKALSSATTDDIGKIIGSDGKVHVLHWDLPEGVSPVAMIASISSAGHGSAIAINKITIQHTDEENHTYPVENFSWDNSGWANDGRTATEIFNNWALDNKVDFGEWCIPSKDEYQNMILSCRIDGDATEASDEMTSNGFRTKLNEAGVDVYNQTAYWTSTPYVDDEEKENYRYYMHVDKHDNGFINNFWFENEVGECGILPVLKF